MYQGESDKASEEQLNICFTALERNPKFLAISAANTNMGIQCLKRAQERNIIVAEMDSQIPIAEAQQQGLNIAFSVGSDNYELGRVAAQHALTILKSERPKILILEGAAGAIAGKQRVDGFREELLSKIPKTTVVGSTAADWDRLKAMNITTDILQRNSDLDLIYAANDLMALAAREVERTLELIRNERSQSRIVILVSHRLNDVFAVADRIVVFKHGNVFSDNSCSETTLPEVVERIVG